MQQLQPNSQFPIPMAMYRISAGYGADAIEGQHLLDINEMITGGREGFVAYEVTGDSMVDRIQPGNIIFVDTWAQPSNGQIVAAFINGLVCVKVFQRSRRGLYLVSSNAAYKPKEIHATDAFHVLGVIRGNLAVGSMALK